MKKKYFTVGPTEIAEGTAEQFSYAINNNLFSISHRSKEFEDLYSSTVNSLKTLLNIPDDFYVFFLSSATECMERIVQNLVERKSYHFINGYFAERFLNISKQLGKETEFIKSEYGKDFNSDDVVISDDAEMICVTHNETSTGVVFDTKKIYELKNKYPDKIIAVDIVTSVPYYKFDFNFIDVAFFSVQKGFGLPPGLGVMVCRKRLINKAKELSDKGIVIGSYNSFLKLAANADKNQTTMTPNIPAIYLLGKSCETILNNGLETMRSETEKKANVIYNFFDKHPNIKPFVKEKDLRSLTTIVLKTELDTNKIHTKLEYNDFVVSTGYGDYKDKHVRIGNFPMHKFEDVSNLIYLFKKF
jgi:phosphoserine aminotransferase